MEIRRKSQKTSDCNGSGLANTIYDHMQINKTSEQVLSRQLYTKVVVIYFVLLQRMAHDTTEVTQAFIISSSYLLNDQFILLYFIKKSYI